MRLFETSTKDSINIYEAFISMIKDIISDLQQKSKNLKEVKEEKEEEMKEDFSEKKCSSNRHENENAKSYFHECRIYICKKCEEF